MRNKVWWLGLLAACRYSTGGYEGGDYGGDYGAVSGGAQDIGYARDVIANGGVPDPSAFPVEGLFAEHDIPVDGAPCESLLCARPSIGRAPWLDDGTVATFVQLGMSSGLPAPYQRPPMDLVVVLDKSSSMSGDIGQAEAAIADAVRQMGPNDRLAVIAAGDQPRVIHDLARVTDADALIHDVTDIRAGGGVTFVPAMEHAYQMFDAPDGRRLRRVMLFTCGYGFGGDFDRAVREAADDHIGTSVFGVLLGYDAHTADLLGTTHGGSFHYLTSLADVEHLFDVQGFDFLVSPIAYDLHFGVALDETWAVQGVYGAPGDTDLEAMVDVNTAFLSQGHGATFLRVAPTSEGGGVTTASRVATVTLDYTPEPAFGLDAEDEGAVDVQLPPDGEPASPGVQKGAALLNEAIVLAHACQDYASGDPISAIARLQDLATYLREVRLDLDDAELEAEIKLVDQLILNMQ